MQKRAYTSTPTWTCRHRHHHRHHYHYRHRLYRHHYFASEQMIPAMNKWSLGWKPVYSLFWALRRDLNLRAQLIFQNHLKSFMIVRIVLAAQISRNRAFIRDQLTLFVHFHMSVSRFIFMCLYFHRLKSIIEYTLGEENNKKTKRKRKFIYIIEKGLTFLLISGS